MTTHEPATPFWDGYRRSPEMTKLLVNAFRSALESNPEMRIAQLLANNGLPDRPYLFHIYDEDFLDLLERTL